jgi:uncharacterized protein
MNRRKSDIIRRTTTFVRKRLLGECSGHDWWHTSQVFKNAVALAQAEKADLFIVSLAALLHDVADYKLHGGDCEVGPATARRWLEKQGVVATDIEHVCGIIRDMSFKGARVKSAMPSLEGKIVQDADRLEAIGATGIARAFAYGGRMGRIIYDPDIKPVQHKTFRAYKRNASPTINHFYEKLLLLKDLMNTKSARRIARVKHARMVIFLKAFFEECDQERTLLARELREYS